MASAASQAFVQQLYVSYYGRPADAAGLQYWAQRVDDQGRGAIINAFGTSEEFTNQYGNLDSAALVNSLYQQMFGRQAEAAGRDYYVGQLDSGQQSLAEIAVAIGNGAQGSDDSVLSNRIEVAQRYTANTQAYDEARAEALVQGINANTPQAEIDSLLADLGPGPAYTVQGQTEQTSFSVADSQGIRFENVNTDQTLNVNGLSPDKRVEVANSNVKLNLDKVALDKLVLSDSTVTLFTNDQTVATVLSAEAQSDSRLDLAGSVADNVQTTILEGDGNLTLTGASLGSAVGGGVNLDASNMSGRIDIAEGVLDTANDIKTGSGDDRINIDVVDGSFVLDGGDGSDTLVVNGSSSDTSLAAFAQNVNGIEAVEFDNNVTINASELPGVGTVTLDSLGTVSNLAADQRLVGNAQGDGPLDSDLILKNAGETVSVESRYTPGQTGPEQELDLKVLASDGAAIRGTLNLSGDAPVEYEDRGRGFDTIDASELNGGLDLEGAGYRAETVKLGSGADSVEAYGSSTYANLDKLENFDVNADELVDVSAAPVNVDGAADLTAAFETAASNAGGGTVYFGFDGSTFLYAENDDQSGLSGEDFAVELVGTPAQSVEGTPLTS